MAQDKVVTTCLWILLVIFVTIIWPICAYAIYILRKDWNKCYFIKRRRNTICLMLILCCIALFVNLPLLIMANIMYDSPQQIPIHVFLPVIVPTKFTTFSCSMLVMIRVWLYYFDIHYSKEMSTKEWKALINSCDLPREWFTQNRRKWGCHNWCSLRVLMVCAILVMIYSILYIKLSFLADIYGLGVYATLTISTIIIWHKYPVFNDALGIRDELKRILIVWIVGLCIANGCIFWIFYSKSTLKGYMAAIIVISTNLCCIVYVTIIAVHNQHKHCDKVQMQYPHIQSSSTNNYSNVKVTKWKPIVSRIDGYILFMNHLQKEFSIENLLFITEYAQFKAIIMEIYPDEMEKLGHALQWQLTLPPSDKLPLSCIVGHFRKACNESNNNDYEPFLIASRNLYQKYIKPSFAPFEVNLSSRIRYAIGNIFENKDPKVLNTQKTLEIVLSHLDEAVRAIEMLMLDSFSRFKITNIAKEYWALYIVVEK